MLDLRNFSKIFIYYRICSSIKMKLASFLLFKVQLHFSGLFGSFRFSKISFQLEITRFSSNKILISPPPLLWKKSLSTNFKVFLSIIFFLLIQKMLCSQNMSLFLNSKTIFHFQFIILSKSIFQNSIWITTGHLKVIFDSILSSLALSWKADLS